ncbi:MAG: ISAs1 family transposase [Bacteroidota bacterium]|nr:ISAs1 family transposase [Bacteroidota bacterium]
MKKDLFQSYFKQLEDPRSHINKLHSLNDILVVGVVAVICGAETWKQMEEFAKSKEIFLKTILELPNGLPSDDTFNRVFSAIDTKQFETCFANWVTSLPQEFKQQVIAIDGKTVRGAKSHGENSPIHIVGAWASENNLVAGQVKVSDKSNEITAIPELLDLLFIEGDIVTIDAMGTQTAIAEKIKNKGADYILAVKNNQPQLFEEIKDEFRFCKFPETSEDIDFGHGRIETRVCTVISDFQFLNKEDTKWKGLNQVIKVESTREFKNSDRKTENATRYFISSLDEKPEKYQNHIRSHWAVENKLHWVLDVAFSEDASRKRNENAAQNYSIVLKIALNLFKSDKSTKQGIAGKRLKAAWNEDYLRKLLKIKV